MHLKPVDWGNEPFIPVGSGKVGKPGMPEGEYPSEVQEPPQGRIERPRRKPSVPP